MSADTPLTEATQSKLDAFVEKYGKETAGAGGDLYQKMRTAGIPREFAIDLLVKAADGDVTEEDVRILADVVDEFMANLQDA